MRKLWLAAITALLALPAAAQNQAPTDPGMGQQEPAQQQPTQQQPTQQQPQQQQPTQQMPDQQQNQQMGQMGQTMPQTVEGRISGVDHLNRTVTISQRQGEQIEVQIPENARISLDGTPTNSLGLVREGQFVRASMQGQTAQTLDVRVRQYAIPAE